MGFAHALCPCALPMDMHVHILGMNANTLGMYAHILGMYAHILGMYVSFVVEFGIV